MRKTLYGILIVLIGLVVLPEALPFSPRIEPIAVFPGAQGFGTATPAGRGGRIIKVTNLKDSGPGSLRAAIAAATPRIVVFEVSGTIKLSSPIFIKQPFITIAGQTAPSPGISLRDGFLAVRTHDVLIQHLRFRVGDQGTKRSVRDGINCQYPATYNVVFDHCSISWGVDENCGINNGVKNITISNCIISEGLNDSFNKKGPHSKAILIGENCTNVSLVRNLVAHHMDRHPNLKGGSEAVSVNNLWYDGGYRWVSISDPKNSGPQKYTDIGNVYLNGGRTTAEVIFKIHDSVKEGTQIYVDDTIHSGSLLTNGAPFNPMVSTPPIWHPSIRILPAVEVERWVSANSGARPADRDAVDKRIVHEVVTRTGRIIDSPSEVGGWPDLEKNYRPFPIPSIPHGDFNHNGYTRIEEVLHAMAAEVENQSRLHAGH